jgi:hypothetical protein
MFQVPRNPKFYKERKDNTITREDDIKLFHFRNESVQWIADFLGNDDEETRGGALSSVMKIKTLLRYVADLGIKKKTECVVKTYDRSSDRSETFVLQGNIVIIHQSLLNSIFTTKLYILMKKINYKQR